MDQIMFMIGLTLFSKSDNGTKSLNIRSDNGVQIINLIHTTPLTYQASPKAKVI